MSIKADAEQVVGTHTFDSTTQMDSSVKEILEGTDYAASSLKLLTGGNTNFIYLAQLEKPLPDGTAEVVIKHGEEFVALNPDWNIGTTRCHIEEQSLRLLDQFPQFTSPVCQVRSPRLLHFNAANNTQIQEYLPEAVNLKDYACKHFETLSPEAMKPHCLQIGRGLGQWLRAFHGWSEQPAQSNVRELFATNSSLQNLKKMINYDRLLHMVTKYPSFLEDSKDIFQQVIDMTAAELQDQTKLHAIHGDFWTGNILIPDTPLADDQQIQLRIVDWEMGQLGVRPEDFGQLVAELWELKLYKDIDAGLWMIEGFADGYGSVDDDFVFRALIHTGAHLVSMGSNTPGWGTPEQGEQVAKAGNDVLVKAWKKDRTWFDKHDLACAFH